MLKTCYDYQANINSCHEFSLTNQKMFGGSGSSFVLINIDC